MRRDGFALITSLIALAVVMALGVGAMYLTQMNLRLAENGRTHAIAKANAEAGLEAATIVLTRAFEESGTNPKSFPETFTTSSIPGLSDLGLQFEVVEGSYSRTLSPPRASVAIRGLGPRNAEFVTEALLGADRVTDPKYMFGMISERSVGVSGASGTFINAGLHSNTGINLPGWKWDTQFKYCTPEDRDINGMCTNPRTYPTAQDIPLTVYQAPGGSAPSCRPPGSGFCDNGTVLPEYLVPDPQYVNVDYYARRYRAAGGTTEVDDDGNLVFATNGLLDADGNIDMLNCGTAEDTLCDNSGVAVTYSASDVNGKTIVANGDITITCSSTCDLSDTTVISTNGTVTLSGIEDATDTRIFSEGSLDIPNEMNWFGESTIASASNINFQGTGHTFETPSGTTVGIAIIAEGNITVRGGGGTAVVGVFIAGGTFRWSGGGNVYVRGAVLTKDGIGVSGGYTIDTPAAQNPDLDNALGIPQILSRR